MPPDVIVLWILIAVLQGHGPTGGAFGSNASCEEQKAVFLQSADVLFLSECTPVKMLPKDLVTKQ